MQYINFVFESTDRGPLSDPLRDPAVQEEPVLYMAPVDEPDAHYFAKVIELLKPLSNEQYMNGPAPLQGSAANQSYILDGTDVYWLIEWDPGLVVVRFTPDGAMAWTALRSPVPGFGGRDFDESEWDDYDEDNNPQYNLIFTPWDAQFDEQDREWGGFVPADPETIARFESALAPSRQLYEAVQSRSDDENRAWWEQCQSNLDEWTGEGIRLGV